MTHYVSYEFLGNVDYKPFKSYFFCKVRDEYYDGFAINCEGFKYLYKCIKEAIASRYNIDDPNTIKDKDIIIIYHEECGSEL